MSLEHIPDMFPPTSASHHRKQPDDRYRRRGSKSSDGSSCSERSAFSERFSSSSSGSSDHQVGAKVIEGASTVPDTFWKRRQQQVKAEVNRHVIALLSKTKASYALGVSAIPI